MLRHRTALSGDYEVIVTTNNFLRILLILETQVETKILLKFGAKILPIEFRGYANIVYNTEGNWQIWRGRADCLP